MDYYDSEYDRVGLNQTIKKDPTLKQSTGSKMSNQNYSNKFENNNINFGSEPFIASFNAVDDDTITNSMHQRNSYLNWTNSSAFHNSNYNSSIQVSSLPNENEFSQSHQLNVGQSNVANSKSNEVNMSETNQNQFQSPLNSRYNFDNSPDLNPVERTPDMMRLYSDLLTRQLLNSPDIEAPIEHFQSNEVAISFSPRSVGRAGTTTQASQALPEIPSSFIGKVLNITPQKSSNTQVNADQTSQSVFQQSTSYFSKSNPTYAQDDSLAINPYNNINSTQQSNLSTKSLEFITRNDNTNIIQSSISSSSLFRNDPLSNVHPMNLSYSWSLDRDSVSLHRSSIKSNISASFENRDNSLPGLGQPLRSNNPSSSQPNKFDPTSQQNLSLRQQYQQQQHLNSGISTVLTSSTESASKHQHSILSHMENSNNPQQQHNPLRYSTDSEVSNSNTMPSIHQLHYRNQHQVQSNPANNYFMSNTSSVDSSVEATTTQTYTGYDFSDVKQTSIVGQDLQGSRPGHVGMGTGSRPSQSHTSRSGSISGKSTESFGEGSFDTQTLAHLELYGDTNSIHSNSLHSNSIHSIVTPSSTFHRPHPGQTSMFNNTQSNMYSGSQSSSAPMSSIQIPHPQHSGSTPPISPLHSIQSSPHLSSKRFVGNSPPRQVLTGPVVTNRELLSSNYDLLYSLNNTNNTASNHRQKEQHAYLYFTNTSSQYPPQQYSTAHNMVPQDSASSAHPASKPRVIDPSTGRDQDLFQFASHFDSFSLSAGAKDFQPRFTHSQQHENPHPFQNQRPPLMSLNQLSQQSLSVSSSVQSKLLSASQSTLQGALGLHDHSHNQSHRHIHTLAQRTRPNITDASTAQLDNLYDGSFVPKVDNTTEDTISYHSAPSSSAFHPRSAPIQSQSQSQLSSSLEGYIMPIHCRANISNTTLSQHTQQSNSAAHQSHDNSRLSNTNSNQSNIIPRQQLQLSRMNTKQVYESYLEHNSNSNYNPTNVSTMLSGPSAHIHSISQGSNMAFSQANRNEIVESPQSKTAYKEFFRIFRIKERESVESAYKYAKSALGWMPPNTIWKVKLELADMSKRLNDFDAARKLYEEVCQLQPMAGQCWLERSKFEEENGNMQESLRILTTGLQMNFNESLLTRAIKQQEKLHNISAARNMLSILKHKPIDRSWRAIFEGALLEARIGNVKAAREIFKYLMENISWYGPIYYEAFCLEDRNYVDGNPMKVIKRGLDVLPRYGPLWFALLRVTERENIKQEIGYWMLGQSPKLTQLRAEVHRAVQSISKELVWKVYFEAAQSEERAADVAAAGLSLLMTSTPRQIPSGHTIASTSASPVLFQCRENLFSEARLFVIRSLLSCPANLRWKIWLAASRLEVSANQISRARQLLIQALREAPPKSKGQIYLECARVEEFAGNAQLARHILTRASVEMKNDWKLNLEVILLEGRHGDFVSAFRIALSSINIHVGAGRLWVILIQLCHRFDHRSVRKQRHTTAASPLGMPTLSQEAHLLPVATDSLVSLSAQTSTDTSTELCESAAHSPNAATPSPRALLASTPNDNSSDLLIPSKNDVLLKALLEVPKSGEVWCEGARCCLNPMIHSSFDLGAAQRSLNFAIQFTPQYGDTFIEYLKLEILCQVFLPRLLSLLGIPFVPFIKQFVSNDPESDIALIVATEDWRNLERLSTDFDHIFIGKIGPDQREIRKGIIKEIVSNSLRFPNLKNACGLVILDSLKRRCGNADPNYGASWFHCRNNPIDTPHSVIVAALKFITHELIETQSLYFHVLYNNVIKMLVSSRASSRVSTAPSAPMSTDDSRINYQYYLASSPTQPLSRSWDTSITRAKGNSNYNSSGSKVPSMPNSALAINSTETAFGNSSLLVDHELDEVDMLNLVYRRDRVANLDTNTIKLTREKELVLDAYLLQQVNNNFSAFNYSNSNPCEEDVVANSAEWPFNKPTTQSTITLSTGIKYQLDDFITAIQLLNRNMFSQTLSLEEKRKVLFGTDQIAP